MSFTTHDSEGGKNDKLLKEIMIFKGNRQSSPSSSRSESCISSDSCNQKILCVGLCRTDIIQVCQEFPEECSELECVDFRWERGGNASNTCTVLAQFETQVEFLGTLSNQQPRLKNLIKDMDDHNILHGHCPVKPNTTCPSSSIVINSSNLTRTRWSYNPDLPELTVNEFNEIDLDDYSWIHFEGRNADNVFGMMELIKNHNAEIRSNNRNVTHQPIVISIELDKDRPGIFKLIPFVDVVFIGENFMSSDDTKNMTKTLNYFNLPNKIKQKPGVIIVCARDERGALGRAPNGEFTQCPAQQSIPIVDMYGTSDTFNAALIYFLNQENVSRNGWQPIDLLPVENEEVSPLEFICPNILYQALVFACRASGAKMGFKGFTQLRDIYENLSIHQEIKL